MAGKVIEKIKKENKIFRFATCVVVIQVYQRYG